DYSRVVHGEQGLVIHRPLPAAGTVRGTGKVEEIIDKGAGRGALLYSSRELRDAGGTLLATLTSPPFRRGDGGLRGPCGPSPPAASDSRACARSLDGPSDGAAAGAVLSPQRRFEPASRRSCGCGEGRVSKTDPARPFDLWPRLPRDRADALRL